MAIEIGALRALLSLDSAAFEKGAKRAEASMNGLQRRLSRIGSNMQKFGRNMSLRVSTPIAAVAGVAVRSSLRTVDAQAKMAASMDTSVVSLQNLGRAADLAGISQGELEGSLLRMTRRISLAEKETGPAVKALKRLNLSAADLNDLPVDKRVQKINEAIRELIPEAQRAGISSEIFGDRTGLAMQRLSSDVIAQATDEIRKFGVGVADVDAAQIEAANDAMSSLGLVTQGLANRLTVALAPTLERIAKFTANVASRFAQMSPEGQRFAAAAALIAAAVGPLAIGLGFVATGLAALASPVGLVILALGAVAGAAAYVAANWDSLKARFPILDTAAKFGVRLGEAWSNLPAIKWALLIPALRWARFIPGLRWAAFIPKITWKLSAGALKWGALIGRLAWAALRVIPVIGWVALAGSLLWKLLVKKIEWDGWIPRIVWADWIEKINWQDWIPTVDWSRVFGGATMGSAGRKAGIDAAQGLARGLQEGTNAVGSAGRKAMRSAIDAAESEGEIKSPSRVFMRIGRDLMAGLGLGVQANTNLATTAVRDGVRDMQGSLNSLSSGASATADRFGDLAARVLTGATSMKDALKQLAAQALSRNLSRIFSGVFGGGGGGGGAKKGLLGLGGFLGFLDSGGSVPAGNFAIAGERGPEIVTGPARVTSRVDTARIMRAGGRDDAAVRVIGGDLTLTDDGTIAARVQVVADQGRGEAVREVKSNLGNWQNELTQRGAIA